MGLLTIFASSPLSSLLIGVYVVITTASLFGLAATGLLTYSVLRQRGLRGSSTYVTLVSLALFDSSCLLSLLVFEWFVYTSGIRRPLCQLLMFAGQAAQSSISYHLVGFSILGYIILVKPLFAKEYLTGKTAIIICAMIWTISLTFSIPLTLQVRLLFFNSSFNSTVPVCVFNPSSSIPWLVVYMITTGFVPVIVIPTSYVAKVCRLRNHPVQSNNGCNAKQVSFRVIISIFLTYVLTCLPNLIYWALFTTSAIGSNPEMLVLGYAFTGFCFVNSCLDSLFYFVLSGNERKNIQCFVKRGQTTGARLPSVELRDVRGIEEPIRDDASQVVEEPT